MQQAGDFASFVVEAGEDPLPQTGTEAGIDLGLTHFAVLSDGRKVANPRFLRRAERKLGKAQKALSRKVRGSSNRAKARIKVARVHARVADARRDWLHKESTRIIRGSQIVAQEPVQLGVPPLVSLVVGVQDLPARTPGEHVAKGWTSARSARPTLSAGPARRRSAGPPWLAWAVVVGVELGVLDDPDDPPHAVSSSTSEPSPRQLLPTRSCA